MLIIVICLLMEEKFLNLKLIIKMLTQYRLSSISNEVSSTKSREVSLNGTVHDFFTLLQFY